MKQRGIAVLALTFAILIFAGCASQNGPDKSLTAKEVAEHIQEAADLSEMKQRDAEQLRKLYRIEESEIADFVLYTASSNVKANELAIIKVKDSRDTEKVMEQISRRIEAQTSKFKDYLPEEYYLIEKHVLKSAGPFVFFIVSSDADLIELALDEVLR